MYLDCLKKDAAVCEECETVRKEPATEFNLSPGLSPKRQQIDVFEALKKDISKHINSNERRNSMKTGGELPLKKSDPLRTYDLNYWDQTDSKELRV